MVSCNLALVSSGQPPHSYSRNKEIEKSLVADQIDFRAIQGARREEWWDKKQGKWEASTATRGWTPLTVVILWPLIQSQSYTKTSTYAKDIP